MSDLIEREDAIKAVKRVSENYTGKGKRDYHPHVDFIVDELKYCVPSADRPQDDDWEKYSDKLWKNAYERGKEEEHRWWSEHCAKCTDADRPQGEWIDKGWHGDWQFETDGRGNCWHEYECSECGYHNKGGKSNYCPHCGAQMKGADDE